jgi:hypothetical protein
LQAQRRIFSRHTALSSVAVAVGYDFLLRLVCRKNPPTLHPAEVVRGSLYSDTTLQADDTAFFLKVQDVVRTTVDEAKFSLAVDKFRMAKK